jgi:hypothetical protein
MSCVTLQRSFASKPRPADHQHRGRAVSLESFLSQEEVSAKGGQDFTNYWKIVEIVQENPKYLIRWESTYANKSVITAASKDN